MGIRSALLVEAITEMDGLTMKERTRHPPHVPHPKNEQLSSQRDSFRYRFCFLMVNLEFSFSLLNAPCKAKFFLMCQIVLKNLPLLIYRILDNQLLQEVNETILYSCILYAERLHRSGCHVAASYFTKQLIPFSNFTSIFLNVIPLSFFSLCHLLNKL